MCTIKEILRLEAAPALGCTEPAAVDLCTAPVKSLIGKKKVNNPELWVDPNVYKNGIGVAIPGAPSVCGIELAAALGVICGKPELKLEVLFFHNQSYRKT